MDSGTIYHFRVNKGIGSKFTEVYPDRQASEEDRRLRRPNVGLIITIGTLVKM